MKATTNNRVARLAAVLILPVLLIAGCDSGDPDEVPETARASFDATNYWASYGEDIASVGNQVFSVQSRNAANGEFEISVRSASLNAKFDGLSSGDDYSYSWDGPSDYRFKGAVGSKQALQETITLMNGRTEQEAEGLVVAIAEIMPGGRVSFTIKEVISLP